MFLRNQVEKRAVLEDLDLDLSCLGETIDEGCVTQLSHPRRHDKPFSIANDLSSRVPSTVLLGNGFNDDNFTSQLAQSGYDRDRHQRADNGEYFPMDCR